MFLYQTERSDHLKSISSLFYHKIPVSTPKTSPISGFSAPCTSVLPKSVGLCEFFTKSTIFSDKPTPRRSKKGLLQRTPSVTASPCQLPLGGSLGVTVSCESLPLRGRWHRVSDDGRSCATASFSYSEITASRGRSCRWWLHRDRTASADPTRGRSSRTCPAHRCGGQGWAASR